MGDCSTGEVLAEALGPKTALLPRSHMAVCCRSQLQDSPEAPSHFFLPSTEGERWPWGWVRRGTATLFAKTDLKQGCIVAGWHRTMDGPY